MTDWDRGAYEVTAQRLEPAAARVVEGLGIQPGERALDVACGTGNGALELARAGASAVGVDQAERLVAVAADRAAEAGLDVEFLVGDAESAEAYVVEQEQSHPMWLDLQPAAGAAGKADELRRRVLSIYEAANEDGGGFLLSVPYRLVTVRLPQP
jgi:SAM-dependent methyltransferase